LSSGFRTWGWAGRRHSDSIAQRRQSPKIAFAGFGTDGKLRALTMFFGAIPSQMVIADEGAIAHCCVTDLSTRYIGLMRPQHPPQDRIAQAAPFFRNGAAFWNAYCSIADSVGERNGDLSQFAPLFVNLAFSGELFLKVLLIVETGTSVRGHDLCKLFNQLPLPVRDAIQQRFDAAQSASQMHGMLASIRPSLKVSFSSALKEASRTFEAWRYPGEGELNAPGPLQMIVEAVKDQLLQTHMALESTLNGPLRSTRLKITAFIGGQ
jgi:hypothetical protein